MKSRVNKQLGYSQLVIHKGIESYQFHALKDGNNFLYSDIDGDREKAINIFKSPVYQNNPLIIKEVVNKKHHKNRVNQANRKRKAEEVVVDAKVESGETEPNSNTSDNPFSLWAGHFNSTPWYEKEQMKQYYSGTKTKVGPLEYLPEAVTDFSGLSFSGWYSDQPTSHQASSDSEAVHVEKKKRM